MQEFTKVSELLKKHYDDNMKSCHDNAMSSCYEFSNSFICHDSKRLSKDDWWYLVDTLEKWRVFSPRAIISKYGALNCWEAMQRTKENRPRVPGAYFTKVVRSLAA